MVFSLDALRDTLNHKDFGLGMKSACLDACTSVFIVTQVFIYLYAGFSCFFRPHMYTFICVFWVSGSRHFKLLLFVPSGSEALTHPMHTQHAHRHTHHRGCTGVKQQPWVSSITSQSSKSSRTMELN